MKTRGMIGFAASCLLATAASAGESGSPRGQAEFVKYCASCHGVSGRGDGPVAPGLKQPPADLTLLSARYGTPLPKPMLVRFIDGKQTAHGSREMPVWGDQLYNGLVGPERQPTIRGTILVILDYLDSIQTGAD